MAKQVKFSKKGCKGKRRYPDELTAKMVLARVKASDSPRRHETRYYACSRCGGFHLTSQAPLRSSSQSWELDDDLLD